jgi:CDP-diacylglycerol--glycerol-3-phosphate 3-phosphatidyltransferase
MTRPAPQAPPPAGRERLTLFGPLSPDAFASVPSLITLARLVGSLVFFVLAVLRQNPLYNYIGLGIHWAGDFSDGFYARRFRQETVLGAEIDIIADRVETLFFFLNFLHARPWLFLPVALYLLDFAFVDFYLSNQFRAYGLISPNYFHKVDRRVYLWNFSPAGKFANSTVVTLALIFLPPGWWPLPAALACILIGIKLSSIVILRRIPKP